MSPGPLALGMNILAASYCFALCATPPNPSPPRKERNIKDRLSFFVGSFAAIVRSIVLFVLLYHAVIVLTSEYAPTRIPHICPRANVKSPSRSTSPSLNADLFTWSRITYLSLFSIYLGAAIRLYAYGGLGRSFTFHLAAPDRLVTSGVYRWIQHPSYTGLVLVGLGVAGLFFRWDGAPGCWISGDILGVLDGWGFSVLAGLVVLGLGLMRARVLDEEDMLRGQFGREWVVWNERTARFIPFVI